MLVTALSLLEADVLAGISQLHITTNVSKLHISRSQFKIN